MMNGSSTQRVGPRRWPAEWEPQDAMWLAWPHNRETWPQRFTKIPRCFERFVEVLADVQQVNVLATESQLQTGAGPSQHLRQHARVTLHELPTNDCWIRDYGPTFVHDQSSSSVVGIDWRYNAWGGKYPPFDLDAAAAKQICDLLGIAPSPSSLVCEGGALEGDGQGTLLTTSSCLLSKARNADWSRERVEGDLAVQLGSTKIVWVDGGALAGDDTDGHIDQLVRFVRPGVVVAAVSSETSDPNSSGLRANEEFLSQTTDAAGQQLTVIPLPTPAPRMVDGQRVPESYCNFLIANEVVIVPTFSAARADNAALGVLREQFPNRTVVPVDATDLIWGLGAFHCASQQQPAAANSDQGRSSPEFGLEKG